MRPMTDDRRGFPRFLPGLPTRTVVLLVHGTYLHMYMNNSLYYVLYTRDVPTHIIFYCDNIYIYIYYIVSYGNNIILCVSRDRCVTEKTRYDPSPHQPLDRRGGTRDVRCSTATNNNAISRRTNLVDFHVSRSLICSYNIIIPTRRRRDLL